MYANIFVKINLWDKYKANGKCEDSTNFFGSIRSMPSKAAFTHFQFSQDLQAADDLANWRGVPKNPCKFM